MNPHQNDPVMAKIWQDGYEYGHYTAVNSASHSLNNASPEVAQEAWNRQQSGDDDFWDQFEESPLSGEWAGGPRMEEILAQAGVPAEESLEYYDYLDDASRVWMDGYNEGLNDGHESVVAPLAGKMDEPGSTYVPTEWTTSAWQGQDDGWGELNPENNLYYHLDCPNCGSDRDYRESALPGQYHCGECNAYSNPDGTPGHDTTPDISAQDLEDWPVLPEHNAAVNPVNYGFVPFAQGELAAFNDLPDGERQRWHARAFNLNRRALKSGQEGRVTGRELYALIHRHDNQCAYCDKPLDWAEPGAGREQAPQAQNSDTAGTIDHNVPLSLGGAGSADNLLPTCWHCNKEMNQWDRRNFDKNLRQPSRIESNPLLDTEPVYARVAVTEEAANAAVIPVIRAYPGGWNQLLDDLDSLSTSDGSPESMEGYNRLKMIVGEFYDGDIFAWAMLFNQFAAGLQQAWDLEQNFRASTVHEVQAKCPNCGTLADSEVCPDCGKSLIPEWNKLDQGKDVPWESLPQMGTPQNEFRSDPTDRVPKVNWGQQDNQFGTMISSVRVAVDDSENWMAPGDPPAGLEGHEDDRTTVTEDEFF